MSETSIKINEKEFVVDYDGFEFLVYVIITQDSYT